MRNAFNRGSLAALIVTMLALPAQAETLTAPAAAPRFSAAQLDRYIRHVQLDRVRPGDGSASAPARRDSVLNGALIGAAIGGVGGSALIVASRGGSDNIPRAMWNVSLLPTLAGAAAGAVIDALR